MDLRVERTYCSLTKAFTELLEEKPYDEITVAQLCEAAMIRRTTFYKHFADKGEFFAFYLKSIRDELETRIGGYEGEDHSTRNKLMLKETLAFLVEHEGLTNNIIDSPSAAMLFDTLSAVIFNDNVRCLKQGVEGEPRNADVQAFEMRAAFVSGGILQMVRFWWAQGCPEGGETRMFELLDTI